MEGGALASIVAEGAASVGIGRGLKSIDFHLVRDDCVTSGVVQGSMVAWR